MKLKKSGVDGLLISGPSLVYLSKNQGKGTKVAVVVQSPKTTKIKYVKKLGNPT
jgi:hypothetical protein